ncbi:MAG: transcription termination/antitermination protein NusG [Chloroflexi bacterium]|nr:transcription termination/antitermination protein NusG [Chloroflexota bacterium]|tara:strand:+ start:1818 stop:2393 length:576 start_codon:yes stop_codon:yes gene_type:complete
MPDEKNETQIETESRWYILHTYSGHEDKVSQNLKQRIENLDLSKTIHEVLVPSEIKIEIKDGERQEVNRKMYAGYFLVKMIMTDDSWFAVRNTPGVTGFVSAEDETDRRPKPVPLESHEVDKIMGRMQSGTPSVSIGLTQGDSVKILDGPFAEFMGTVDLVNKERGKVTVHVSFFGRETPLELDFLQVEKA